MGFSFVPNYMVKRVTDISPKFLKSQDVKVLLCDLDNTISLKYQKEVPQKVVEWKQKLDKAGIELFLFSNNRRGRGEVTAKQLGIRYLEHVGKPKRKGFFEATRITGVPRRNMALCGDQIFTDVLGANRVGVKSIWVIPIDRRTPHLWFRFLIERIAVALNMIFGGESYEKL